MDEWVHFQKLPEEGRVPNSSYWYVLCRHCVAGYEQKQLFNAPSKLTGRRSAMRSHLKVCPIYATQYQMEQQAKAEVEAAASSTTATTVVAPTSTGEKRKRRADGESGGSRGGRGKHCMMEEWEHFTRLQDEGYIGKSNFFYALCKHCQRAYDEAEEDQKPLLVPEKLVGRREKMRKHLSLCPHFKGDLPPLERRLLQRVGASAFSADAVDTLSIAPMGSWPVMMHCNLTIGHQLGDSQIPAIDGIVTNGSAITSLAFVRAQTPEAGVEAALAHNHGLEIARWLDEHIRLCVDATKLALAAVVLPFNTMTQRAVGILRSPTRWPQVVFLSDMEDMLQFPLLKLLATAEMFTVVSSLIEVWQLESIRSCVMERLSEMDGGAHASPFRDWESCATLIQVLLDEKTFESSTKRGAANAKRLVENALNRSLLERVYNLLHAFKNAFDSCRSGLTLSETTEHLGVLFTAAEGFNTVQLELEVVWEQMEQPLFVLAHALNPRLRLRDLESTEITRLSTLSDLSVSYFRSLFGRKPNSLRGEVTAYLHTSQRVFTSEFVAEFPVVDDYFRYLSDNYPSLSMLMKALHSLYSASLVSRSSSPPQQRTTKSVGNMYTNDERQKLDFLRGRWGIASGISLDAQEETKGRIAAHYDRSGAAMLNAGVVVDEWKEALESKLHVRGVDFSLLEDEFDDIEDPDIALVTTTEKTESNAVDRTMHDLKLPSLELDDKVTYPSATLRAEFSMKVPLKDLFKTAEATI
ncbi:hypothetical protein PC118_g19708 [Phytophthora cactorum]|uniref:BED-type domain-containing protein n=1 Tax=Phytophthora cactorum TaxID=29920 RepID=A0A8T1F0K3_9STRA|nr:hypothetical protein PC118_g19708 [Phytophthora cactorum]